MQERAHITSVLLVFVLGAGCDTNPKNAVLLEDQRMLYPVILVGGYFEPHVWNKTNAIGYLIRYGLTFGGTLAAGNTPAPADLSLTYQSSADLFTMEVSDPSQRLSAWEEELRQTILQVQRATGSPKVVLVGFGAGGLAARSYVVHRGQDHGVARLVTVATPHAGLDLAELGVMAQEWARDSTWYARLRSGLADFAASSLGMDLGAPVLQDLDPSGANGFLHTLNHTPHPADLVYANIIVDHVGDELDGVGFNGGMIGNINTLPAPHRQELRGIDGLAGIVSQVEVERYVPLSGASDYHALHRAILTAIGGAVHFLRAEIMTNVPVCDHCLLVDFQYTYAGLSHASVEDVSGEVYGVQAAVYSQRNERFGRLTIPLEDGLRWPLMIHIASVDGEHEFLKLVVRSETRQTDPFVYSAENDPEPVKIRVIGAQNIPVRTSSGTDWDLIGPTGGPLPDARLSIFVDEVELASTRVIPEADGAVRWDEQFEFNIDPRHHAIRIALWDQDTLMHDLIASIRWAPGELPSGYVEVVTTNGVRFLLVIEWEVRIIRIIDPHPFRV